MANLEEKIMDIVTAEEMQFTERFLAKKLHGIRDLEIRLCKAKDEYEKLIKRPIQEIYYDYRRELD